MNKTSVVVGRFQVSQLTVGHLFLIDYAVTRGDNLVVVIGENPTRCTDSHPLDFEIRKGMIHEFYPHAHVIKLNDYKEDTVWSQKLDELLQDYSDITLYCSRDGFVDYYSGKHKVVCVNTCPSESGTEHRQDITDNYIKHNNKFFRAGAIWQANYKFPTAYPCVDVAVVKLLPNKPTEILLGRKPNESMYRLCGGFVDPSDESLEDAAVRELQEEMGTFQTDSFTYIGSQRIKDWRYSKTKDTIITSLFLTYYISGQVKAGDDLEEVKWIPLHEAENLVFEGHKKLISKIRLFIHNKEEYL